MNIWKIIVVISSGSLPAEQDITAEICEVVYGAAIFKTDGKVIKAFAPGCWATIEKKD